LVGVWHGCVCIAAVVVASPGVTGEAVVVCGVDWATPDAVVGEGAGTVVVVGAGVVAAAVVAAAAVVVADVVAGSVGVAFVVVVGSVVVVVGVAAVASVVVARGAVVPVVGSVVVAAVLIPPSATLATAPSARRPARPATTIVLWSFRFISSSSS
jgi:hypothetical protein